MALSAEEILPLLDFPRENATAGLAHGQAVLDSLLQSVNIAPVSETFSSSPHRLVAAGICLALVLMALAVGCGSRQLRWRIVAIFGLGLALVFASGSFDALLPHAPATNLLVDIAPSGTEIRTVMLSAHYDSKTEPFDHTARGGMILAIVLMLPLAFWAQFRQRTRKRRLAYSMPALLVLSLAALQTLTAPLVRERSHGIRDNAAACALLLELCSRAAHRPLEHTRLQFAWWAGEEIGAQGSAVWVQRHPTDLPDYLLNLEAIGSGGDLSIGGHEWTGRSWRKPSEELAQQLDTLGPRPLRRLQIPLLSDAGPFLGMGAAGITLLNLPADSRWPHALHSKADRMESLHQPGLDATRTLLLKSLLYLDALPVAADGHVR